MRTATYPWPDSRRRRAPPPHGPGPGYGTADYQPRSQSARSTPIHIDSAETLPYLINDGQGLSGGDAQLPLDQVHTRHHLRHRVLHLQPIQLSKQQDEVPSRLTVRMRPGRAGADLVFISQK